ncbi:hypothetical protein WL88_25830 [Burkholderia diffusa]|uniref:Rieske domain-containing protein n=1 Tax=Burkholderia diffusa TaxID=488732 RepID=A0AAW3PAL3_9BURK|nr:non-heme iron oxygenase ferredoxin subunit [Burkholderia diffusa]KWF32765.1 hypothetical protein WL86_29870 [Burkholderia diffusa]KWF38689.1 hypothetical protein WL85_11015 [Burkholderia diffusa]KWF46734.1 hypothetical protein WL88_25830 [Burkholderia diffusa]KWF50695.1 hypothetical protein WL87_16090 [Burkholderia diffusa]
MLDENREDNWVRAGAVADVDPGGAIAVRCTPPIALFNVDGEFYATDEMCSHGESSLVDGYIEDATVECAFHYAVFSIKDGSVLAAPATEPLCTYETRVINGEVFVNAVRRGSRAGCLGTCGISK